MTWLYPLACCPGGPELSFSSFFSPFLCPSLSVHFCLRSVWADGQTGRSVLSLQDFGSHTIGLRSWVHTLFCLAGKPNKERKEKKSGRKRSCVKERLNCLHVASRVCRYTGRTCVSWKSAVFLYCTVKHCVSVTGSSFQSHTKVYELGI